MVERTLLPPRRNHVNIEGDRGKDRETSRQLENMVEIISLNVKKTF